MEAIVARQDFSQYNGSTYSALALLVTIPGGEREEVVTTSNSCGYSDLALCRKGDRVRVDIYRSDKAHRWAVSGSPEIVLDADQLREELKSTDE